MIKDDICPCAGQELTCAMGGEDGVGHCAFMAFEEFVMVVKLVFESLFTPFQPRCESLLVMTIVVRCCCRGGGGGIAGGN